MAREHHANIITLEAKGAASQIGLKERTTCIANNIDNIVNFLSNRDKQQQIIVYDITHAKKLETTPILNIKDHINQTGENWLRGNQNKLKIGFIDITKLYENQRGVITTCLGKNYNNNNKLHQYPSTYICNIAIVVRALGFYNISGKLINLNAQKNANLKKAVHNHSLCFL